MDITTNLKVWIEWGDNEYEPLFKYKNYKITSANDIVPEIDKNLILHGKKGEVINLREKCNNKNDWFPFEVWTRFVLEKDEWTKKRRMILW